MPKSFTRTACTLILNADNTENLLIEREDFRAWVPPAGDVDEGEDWVTAATCEAREESGLHVAQDALIGEYTRPQFADIVRVYAAHATGGSLDEHG
jgi:ADP-ribose pyrophosphatase YjhB (NUDIX family)